MHIHWPSAQGSASFVNAFMSSSDNRRLTKSYCNNINKKEITLKIATYLQCLNHQLKKVPYMYITMYMHTNLNDWITSSHLCYNYIFNINDQIYKLQPYTDTGLISNHWVGMFSAREQNKWIRYKLIVSFSNVQRFVNIRSTTLILLKTYIFGYINGPEQ